MNNMIRDRKATGSMSPTGVQSAPTGQQPYEKNQAAALAQSQMHTESKVEQLMLQLIIKYGDRVVFKNIEDADGNLIEFSIGEYIHYNLSADGLSFENELYNRILQEVAEKVSDRSFKTEPYFVHHHDINISQLAINMTEERFKLSESQQEKNDDDSLKNRAIHLMLDFRMEYIEKHLRELKQKIAKASSDELLSLMAEYKEMTEMRNILAKQLGNNIIV